MRSKRASLEARASPWLTTRSRAGSLSPEEQVWTFWLGWPFKPTHPSGQAKPRRSTEKGWVPGLCKGWKWWAGKQCLSLPILQNFTQTFGKRAGEYMGEVKPSKQVWSRIRSYRPPSLYRGAKGFRIDFPKMCHFGTFPTYLCNYILLFSLVHHVDLIIRPTDST